MVAVALNIAACGQKEHKVKSYVAIFEIPATNIDRAIDFYQQLLGVKIEKLEFEGMKMGLLPQAGQQVVGTIIMGEGYVPTSNGVTVYLNAGENLQGALDKVTKFGGKVLVPKTPHADGKEFFAIFSDTEGNKLGLHSPK